MKEPVRLMYEDAIIRIRKYIVESGNNNLLRKKLSISEGKLIEGFEKKGGDVNTIKDKYSVLIRFNEKIISELEELGFFHVESSRKGFVRMERGDFKTGRDAVTLYEDNRMNIWLECYNPKGMFKDIVSNFRYTDFDSLKEAVNKFKK